MFTILWLIAFVVGTVYVAVAISVARFLYVTEIRDSAAPKDWKELSAMCLLATFWVVCAGWCWEEAHLRQSVNILSYKEQLRREFEAIAGPPIERRKVDAEGVLR
jgi:D-alanyl-lipoteichoic acid acyltransferase DltB (MBOAT superfamily)